MFFTPFSLSKTLAYLEYFRITGGQQSFHAQFRRGMQKHVTHFDGINVDFRGRCRDKVGCFNLQIAVINKKTPYDMNKPGALPKIFTLGRQSLLGPFAGAIL